MDFHSEISFDSFNSKILDRWSSSLPILADSSVIVPDGKGYLSANQDSDVKSNRIESSYVKKKVVQNISQDAYVLK